MSTVSTVSTVPTQTVPRLRVRYRADMSAAMAEPAKKKGPDIQVLRCLNPACRGMLAYEVDSSNVLYVDLAWMARAAGESRYFPCPHCGGRNVVEPFTDEKGKQKHRVTRFEAA